MKKTALMAFSATVALAQVSTFAAPPAALTPVSAAAPVALTSVSTASVSSSAEEAAPLAPISTVLLQNHPGAPVGVDDVLLVPSASAGQKAAAFNWSNADNTEAYVLWNKFFAAAQYTGGGATDAQTLASFGYMTSAFGAGLTLASRDSITEDVADNKKTTHERLGEIKLFGSAALAPNFDAYASLMWKLGSAYAVEDNQGESANPAPRVDSILLSAGLRKYPAANVEGVAWNVSTTDGIEYSRTVAGQDNYVTYIGRLDGQYGYVAITDGITFLPGVDAYLHYANGPRDPDYGLVAGVSPYAAIILPLFDHLSLKGGARYSYEFTVIDHTVGKPSSFSDHDVITNTSGSFGLRYERKRWAVEAQVANSFLSNGPSSISGNTTNTSASGGLLYGFALTVNLK